jgi:glycosyltransferase involved in cell wall biosynthesis
MSTIVFQWGMSSFFGWGVYGLNLMLHRPRSPATTFLCSGNFDERTLSLNPLERMLIRPMIEQSRTLQAGIRKLDATGGTLSCPVLHSLGRDFLLDAVSVDGKALTGAPTIGVIFTLKTEFSPEARRRAAQYQAIIAGSAWNRDSLRSAGIARTELVIQGVDPTLFYPGPRQGWLDDRFVVFAGGKLEFRKAQDLVLLAFRAFAARHPDALLVTAWNSPFSRLAASLEANRRVATIPLRADGSVDVPGWVTANGIAADQLLDLGAVPNAEMPRILREMDVALFPNRCEGGTNLVAMECMACGVPTILSRNTGHLDLIGDDTCFSLDRQRPVDGADPDGYDGWGESDIDEIVATLERIYQDRAAAKERGRRGAELLKAFTWAATAEAVAETVERYAA